MSDERCKCDLRTRLVGDGCRYCNPQYYIDMLEEQIKEEELMMKDMAEALAEIIAISDRNHLAWNKGKIVLQKYHNHHG